MKKSRYSDNQILNILRTGFLLPLACGKIRNEDYDTEKCGCVLLLTLVKNGVITLLRLCMIARPDPFSPCGKSHIVLIKKDIAFQFFLLFQLGIP